MSGSSITGEDNISAYMSCTILSAMRLECVGMKGRQNVCAGIKKKYGMKGNKLSVLKQYMEMHIQKYGDDNGPVLRNTKAFIEKMESKLNTK